MCLKMLKQGGKDYPKQLRYLIIFTFIIFSYLTSLSIAAETRHHEAHVHGIGKLNIALDGEELLLELRSPAANIVGFEHAPENDEQVRAVKEVTALLKSGDNLFKISPKAQCKLHEADVESSMAEGDHTDGHKDGHKDDNGANHEHDKAHADAHSKEGHEEDSIHSEFVAVYHFDCKTPGNLNMIDVQLFSIFPGFEELEVQLLSNKGQKALELTPKKHLISL